MLTPNRRRRTEAIVERGGVTICLFVPPFSTLTIRLSPADYIARLSLMALILAVNGFFAAAETALLTVRDSRLRRLADEGVAGAKTALALLAKPEKLLSVTQIGVTLNSFMVVQLHAFNLGLCSNSVGRLFGNSSCRMPMVLPIGGRSSSAARQHWNACGVI